MDNSKTTPVRLTRRIVDAGVTVLSQPEIAYVDGGEAAVLDILEHASDLSSASGELAGSSTSWATEYSTSPSRANFLRALDLDPDSVALEIGGGCGPITRYLGEACRLVDMVEPVRSRAIAAAARTRDQENVRVFLGVLTDVPPEPIYDLIVVCGVLEYVGEGSANALPYLTFLRGCAERLAPDGHLIVAIENALGVKYLSGASEDHTGRPFDGLEGYLLPTGARTFSRRWLESMFQDVGLVPESYGAFPDYKLTRAVIAPRAFSSFPDLVSQLPRFPSRDYSMTGLDCVDEKRLWQHLVASGTGREHSNSWVVVATRGPTARVWPDSRLASLVLTERDARYMSRTEFDDSGGEIIVRRTHLGGIPSPDTGPQWRGGEEPYVEGPLLEDLLGDGPRRGELLSRWIELVRDEGESQVDLVPANIVIAGDQLRPIDQEWSMEGYSWRTVVTRGLILAVANQAKHLRWESVDLADTVLAQACAWANESGFDLSPDDAAAFVSIEAQFQAAVSGTPVAREIERLESLVSMPRALVRGSTRIDVVCGPRAESEIIALRERQDDLTRELAAHQARVAELVEAYVGMSDAKASLEAETADLRATLDEAMRRPVWNAVRQTWLRVRRPSLRRRG